MALQSEVSYALQEAIVQACGTVFWYKKPLKTLLMRAGVPAPLIEKYWDAPSKYILVRDILAELDNRGVDGVRVQHQLARELAAMRTVANPDQRENGLAALADLRAVAKQEAIIEDEEGTRRRDRKHAAQESQKAVAARAKGLVDLNAVYLALVASKQDAQQRGYDLERLLGGLFKLHDIPFTSPFRKGTVEQTDGFFKFEGFEYLIEARWRSKPPGIAELRAFSGKVKGKIQSTRGLFVSVAGFRPEVLTEASGLLNLVFMDGQDLALILEGRISLREALRTKLDRAAQLGILFYSLGEHVA
jgi:hypothetical protein